MFWTNLRDPEFTDTFLDIFLPFRIATFFITKCLLAHSSALQFQFHKPPALAIIQVRGHQELSILLSVDH